VKLSFIVPYYNGKKYIKECLDSLYHQDIPESEYEVIIVDDCSTDQESIDVISAYQKGHNNLLLIHNDTNSRCGESRNHGLSVANGEYIWFVDQDDYISFNCLNSLLETCHEEKLDILVFDYADVNDDLTMNNPRRLIKDDSKVMSGLDYIENRCNGDFWNKEYDTNVWHCIYRKRFMIDNKIFSPKVSYCEDMIVAQHAIICASRIKALSDNFYRYRCNPQSVFHTEVGKKGRPIFDASIYAGSEIISLSQMIIADKYQSLKTIVYSGGVGRINSFAKAILKINTKERKAFFEQIQIQSDVVNRAKPHLLGYTKWIINHPHLVKAVPHIVYLYIKTRELL